MSESLLVSELQDKLKLEEARLADVESQRDLLKHERNSLRDTIRMIADHGNRRLPRKSITA